MPRHRRARRHQPSRPMAVRIGGAAVALTLGLAGGLGAGAASARWDEQRAAPVVAVVAAETQSPRTAPRDSRSAARPDADAGVSPSADPAPVPTSEPTPTAADPAPLPTPEPVPTPVPEPGSGLLGTEPTAPPSGVFVVAAGEAPAPGSGTVRTVRVEVEEGLPVDAEVFADAVLATLNDPRGWSGPDGVTFARTAGDGADIRVVMASPATTDALCAPLRTNGTYSCGVTGTAVLNFTRWVSGATDFGADVATYRQYVVNHEVGHVLGHSHASCPAPGEIAPVMVQQTMSAQGCQVNGWPNPSGS